MSCILSYVLFLNCKNNLPLEKQNWKRNNSWGTMISIDNQRPSVQNAFTVLSDYFGDIHKILAEWERCREEYASRYKNKLKYCIQ